MHDDGGRPVAPDSRAGTFRGQENPLINIHTANLHEITPYISPSRHRYEVTPVIASRDWWNGPNPSEQKAVRSAAEDAGWYQRGQALRPDARLKSTLKAEGVQFGDLHRCRPDHGLDPFHAGAVGRASIAPG